MSTATWMKGKSKPGKVPTKAFDAVLEAWYPGEIKTGTKALKLDFKDDVGSPINIVIFGTGKAVITENNEVMVGGSLADFQESLEALSLTPLWGVEGGELLGFKTEPLDLPGCRLWMEPLIDRTIGDEKQTKDRISWGTVKQYKKVDQSKGATVTTTKKPGPKTKEQDISNIAEMWKDPLAVMLADGALSERQIMEGLKVVMLDSKKREPLQDRRHDSLIALVDQEYLSADGPVGTPETKYRLAA